jgi:hypothetical protein
MSNRLASYVIAGALLSALALASPALAKGGGMGMGGGGHGMGGGMGMGHGMGGGMGMGHYSGGGMGWGGRSMGMVGHPSWGVGPHVGTRSLAAMPMSRAALAPQFSRAAFVPHHPFFFHHRFHRFNRFAFVGGPFFFAGYDGCWRRVWTAWGPQWINVCSDYGWGY